MDAAVVRIWLIWINVDPGMPWLAVGMATGCWRVHMILTASRILLLAVAAFAMTRIASAQTAPPHVPLQKTIGAAKPEVVPSLFVLNARGATLQSGKLVLTGVSPNAIVFADRPVRAAGHDLTSRIVEDWGSGSDNFQKDPPNATVSVFQKEGNGVRDVVVVLKNPKLEGENLAFDVVVLEGDIKGADGAASVFIDVIGRPFTPMSFAGAARRTAWRGAYYGGAAAAVGAAAAYGAYGPRPACGYYPYPPCY